MRRRAPDAGAGRVGRGGAGRWPGRAGGWVRRGRAAGSVSPLGARWWSAARWCQGRSSCFAAGAPPLTPPARRTVRLAGGRRRWWSSRESLAPAGGVPRYAWSPGLVTGDQGLVDDDGSLVTAVDQRRGRRPGGELVIADAITASLCRFSGCWSPRSEEGGQDAQRFASCLRSTASMRFLIIWCSSASNSLVASQAMRSSSAGPRSSWAD